ncbi:MAG: hypothetical protein PF904_05375 [Kiritimatiellae bacterium]|jgi:hypothetical protein|nr:hypothetical protein [Kiritimatiellia bacterium]
MTKLQTIEKEAAVLSPGERASLIATLLNSFKKTGYTVSDEEVIRRDAEMEAGIDPGLSHSEFVKNMGR